MHNTNWIYAGITLLELAVVVRAIVKPHRTQAARIAWIVVIAAIPALGIIAYLLFGETSIGRRRQQRSLQLQAELPKLPRPSEGEPDPLRALPPLYENLFEMAESISEFPTVGGNRGELLSDSNLTIDRLVADIATATDHVHLLFYIWLDDTNGRRMVDALVAAAARGVTCRVLVDDIGSKELLRSTTWTRLREGGVHTAVALPVGNLLLSPLRARVDLRNHRKIAVIDDRVTYCGSQNCADPEFHIKAKFAPWVDCMIRFEGPVARQNNHLFANDWMLNTDDDLTPLLNSPAPQFEGDFPAVAFGTGPTIRNAAMPEMFASLMHAARREIIITTPYFVPDESMLNALRACAHRGDDTTIIFPARNDSRIVAAASESFYPDLLRAGVKIYEYVGGLLHSKTVTVDGQICLIGSANMDRRSFDLNYENNILFFDEALTEQVKNLQQHYLSRSNPVTIEMVENWSLPARLWKNTIGMLGPLL